MPMTIAVAIGGAFGAMSRYWVAKIVQTSASTAFPLGTLSVNVIGSFLIGLLSVVLVERLSLAPEWRAMILVGGLGAFTTFSTFSLDTLLLVKTSGMLPAFGNVALNVVVCLIACAVGLWLGRQI